MDRKHLIESAIETIDRKATDRQREAGSHYLRALSGDIRSKAWLQEGISTSDIPELLQPAINVQFLAQFAEYPTVWQEIVGDVIDSPRLGSVEFGDFNFSTEDLLGDHDGDTYTGMGLPGVGEYGEYPAVNFETESLEAELRKNGVRLRISWEALVNLGNFDVIGRATRAFARYASEQEDVALAKVFVSAAGVVNTGFTSVTSDPALSIPALEAAIGQAQALTIGGRPVGATSFRLVVPTTLSQTAAQVTSVNRVEETDGSFVYDRSTNFGSVSTSVFPALEAVGNYATPGTMDDQWFLVAQGTARPALAEVFLQGYRTPLISVKDSGHFTLGGGVVPAREGNFEVDDVETRARHVVGAAAIEPSLVLHSKGDA